MMFDQLPLRPNDVQLSIWPNDVQQIDFSAK